MNQKRLLMSMALISAMFGGTRYAEADLIGSQVTIATYCCTSPTEPADLVPGTQQTGIVPVTFSETVSGVIATTVDITADQIILTSLEAGLAESGTFNGGVYNFSGLSSPITDVTVDPASNFTPVSVNFTDDSIYVNEAGQTLSVGDETILDVTTGGAPPPTPTPTPEPASIALLGAGLAGLGLVRRRRKEV
jgi:PEP-CTERM motif